ncbi:MAG TPA: hypothetical protein VFE71_12235, partial [Bacteroidales bacterium]|nr:hypothetical protein [Bacteroidales bacterium]
FGKIHEEDLISLACELSYVKEFNDDDLNSAEGCIVWTIDRDEKTDIQIIQNGVAGSAGKFRIEEGLSYYVLKLSSVEEFYFQFPIESLCILKYIDDHDHNL